LFLLERKENNIKRGRKKRKQRKEREMKEIGGTEKETKNPIDFHAQTNKEINLFPSFFHSGLRLDDFVDHYEPAFYSAAAVAGQHRASMDQLRASMDQHRASMDQHSASMDQHSASMGQQGSSLDNHWTSMDQHWTNMDSLVRPKRSVASSPNQQQQQQRRLAFNFTAHNRYVKTNKIETVLLIKQFLSK